MVLLSFKLYHWYIPRGIINTAASPAHFKHSVQNLLITLNCLKGTLLACWFSFTAVFISELETEVDICVQACFFKGCLSRPWQNPDTWTGIDNQGQSFIIMMEVLMLLQSSCLGFLSNNKNKNTESWREIKKKIAKKKLNLINVLIIKSKNK